MKLYLSRLALGVTLLWSPLAFAQQMHTLHIDDQGKVLKKHQEHHVKSGNKVTWMRHSGAAKAWFVKFDESPCAEGSEFGSDRAKTCTINVVCEKNGDPGCKSYAYKSATGAAAAMNDPHVVVDPKSP